VTRFPGEVVESFKEKIGNEYGYHYGYYYY
jgi:hypothetical protein